MRLNRGDVVLVDYPFTTGGAKVRPALVVQNDRDNVRLTNTIVAQISSNNSRANEATQHLIELAAEPSWGWRGTQRSSQQTCSRRTRAIFYASWDRSTASESSYADAPGATS